MCDSDKMKRSETMRAGIKRGEYQIIFISPEALFSSTEWRNTLSTDTYQSNLVAFIVDEAHSRCVCMRSSRG